MTRVSVVDPSNPGKILGEAEAESLKELSSVLLDEVWSPSLFKGDTRSVADFQSTQLVVLDVDDGCTLEQAQEMFKPYQHLIMTTRNHQKLKNDKKVDRFRVVLLLNQEVTDALDHQATMDSVLGSYSFADKACRDAARMFYPSQELVSHSDEGRSVLAVKYVPHDPVVREASSAPEGDARGRLWRSTYELLTHGAAPGTRHHALVQAAGNMREQGYTEDEVIELVEHMSMSSQASWTQAGLNDADLKTISDMFSRDPKYAFEPKAEDAREALATVQAKDLLEETFSYLSDKDKVKGDPTGVEGLDLLLGGGFRTGELTVLMAQAKTGKNTLYHYLIHSMLQRGLAVAYASRELSPATEVIPNLLSIHAEQNAWKQDITEEFKDKAREALARWPLYFSPGYGYFPQDQLEQWMRGMAAEGIKHFMFDHFHYMLEGEEYEAVAKLIKKLKSLTKELDVHLNLIVQPRTLRDGEQLSLATLRGGAAIGQALDNLLILERVRGANNVAKLSLEVARHKLARLGHVHLMYDPETTKFTEAERIVANEEVQEQVERHRVQ